MERRPPRGPFSRQPIVYLADGAPRLANEIRHMRQACAPKPIAPAIFPPANSINRKKLPPACPVTTRGRNGAPGAMRSPDTQIRRMMLYPVELRVRAVAPVRGGARGSTPRFQLLDAVRCQICMQGLWR